MFIIPIPPTKRDTAAIPPRSTVIILFAWSASLTKLFKLVIVRGSSPFSKTFSFSPGSPGSPGSSGMGSTGIAGSSTGISPPSPGGCSPSPLSGLILLPMPTFLWYILPS